MKKVIMILVVLACFSGLFAQKGLFNIRYGMSTEEVDEVLARASFYPRESEDNAVKYYSDMTLTVSAIMVFFEPQTSKVAGWFVKYLPDLGGMNYHLIIDRIQNMHGTKNHMDEETNQLIWFLTDVRTLHVMFGPDGGLMALYYDSLCPDLFSFSSPSDAEMND
ncbi:MAG: hypothetical protein GX106_02895 [Candidatus Cloacimonetes bacterium]|nr:hypothetical protein [Candidatus Cloacimonadota bacterium]